MPDQEIILTWKPSFKYKIDLNTKFDHYLILNLNNTKISMSLQNTIINLDTKYYIIISH